jgi:hypothetical protein
MVSTRDGHELFACTDNRYSTSLTPAIDPIDIGSNSVLNGLELREITLARAENEVGLEIVFRLSVAERNVSDFKTEALTQNFQNRSAHSKRITLTSQAAAANPIPKLHRVTLQCTFISPSRRFCNVARCGHRRCRSVRPSSLRFRHNQRYGRTRR